MDFKADSEGPEKDKSKEDDLERAEDHRRAATTADAQSGQEQQHQEIQNVLTTAAPTTMAASTPRDSMTPSQILSPLRFQTPPTLARRLRRRAARMRHSIDVANRRLERRRLLHQQGEQGSRVATRVSAAALARSSLNFQASIGNPAVRVLFRDQIGQQQQDNRRAGSLVRSHSANAINIASGRSVGGQACDSSHSLMAQDLASYPIGTRQRDAVVEASRRLIERQIDAIREADSRRWNFDFSTCQPMHQPNHRYHGHQRQRYLGYTGQFGRESDLNNNTRESAISDDIHSGNVQTDDHRSSENDNLNDDAQQQRQNQQIGSTVRGGQSRNFKPLNDQNQNRDP